MDVMLSVDSGVADSHYRIQKGNGRIVYVEVIGTEGFLGENERNYGPSVVAELSKLEVWKDDSWATLRYDLEARQCVRDPQPPHAVPQDKLAAGYPTYDIAHLRLVEKLKSRTTEVLLGGQTCILKTARFPFELPYMTQEIEAYRALERTSLAPRLVGYAFETSRDRVTGILLEKVEGHSPELGDLDTCLVALEQLHLHLAHGDLVKYNIIMTSEGPKFVDFENSTLVGTAAWSTRLMDDDIRNLKKNLDSTSELGRPRDHT